MPTARSTRSSALLVTAVLLSGLLAACGSDPGPAVDAEDLGATPDVVESPEPTDEASPTSAATTEDDDHGAASDEPRTFDEVCAGRDDEAFIEVLSPLEGATVGSTFTATGCGNTFEATYQWRVQDAAGDVVAEGFGTMTCGTGCVGEFEQEITVDTTGDVTLVVYETSAKDGSEEHVVEVPLTIG